MLPAYTFPISRKVTIWLQTLKYNVYRQRIHMKHFLLCPLTLRVTLKQPPLYLIQWKNSLMLNTLSSMKSVAQRTLPTCQVVKQVFSLVHPGPITKASIIYVTLPNFTLKISFSSRLTLIFFLPFGTQKQSLNQLQSLHRPKSYKRIPLSIYWGIRKQFSKEKQRLN